MVELIKTGIFSITALAFFWNGPLSAWAGEMVYQTSPKVAAYFEKARSNESTLIAFLHKMPKGADLHNHLWGDIEAETLLESALKKGLFFDRVSKSFTAQKPDGLHFTPEQMVETFWNRAEVLEAISMRNAALSGESGHEHFFRSFYRFAAAVPDDRESLRDHFTRAVNQRISYLELMTYPGDGPQWAVEVEDIKNQVLADFKKQGLQWELELRYIYPLDRNSDLEDFRAQLAKGLQTAADPSRRTVALTLLSPEDDRISQTDFRAQMEALDAAWRRLDEARRQNPDNPPPPEFSIHSGELTLEYAAYESLLDRISTTIALGHASRIGHGVSIMWEDKVYELLALMRERGLAVEICLTSNESILKVGEGRHPFQLYWDAAVPVVLATDDQGLSRGTLTNEYAKAAEWFKLSYGELKWLAFNSLEYSFLPGESLFEERDFNRPKPKVEALAQASEKARRQQHLLKAFQEYEAYMEKVIDDFNW